MIDYRILSQETVFKLTREKKKVNNLDWKLHIPTTEGVHILLASLN